MALGPTPPVGQRTPQFRDQGLAPYEGYIPEQGYATGSREMQLVQGLNVALTDQNARLQQIADETRRVTTTLQAQFRNSQGGTAAPVAFAAPPSVFDPTAVATTVESKISQSRERAFAGAAPSRGEGGPSTHEMLEARGMASVSMDSPWADVGALEQPGAMREKIALSIAQRLSNAEWGQPLEYNEQAQRWQDDRSGRFVTNMAGKAFMRRQTIMRGAQNLAANLSEGQSLAQATQGGLSALGLGKLATGIGVAGAVYTGAQVANQWIMGQQAANRAVTREVGGGSMEALHERAEERMFNFKNSFVGGIGGQAASELYQGARSIFGVDQQARDRAMDFGVQMHKIGVDISESLDLIRTAASHGNESLRGLADGIRTVTQTAREQGISGTAARQMFTQQYTAQTQTTGGATAANLAAYETNAVLGMGRDFQDVTLASASSPMALRQQASLMGMSYNEFLARRSESTQFAAQAEESYIRRRNPIAQNAQARELVARRVREIQATGAQVTNADWKDIANEVQRMGIVDAGALASILNSSVATGLTERNAYEFAVRGLQGEGKGLDLGGQAEQYENMLKDSAPSKDLARYMKQFGSLDQIGASNAKERGGGEYKALIEAVGGDPSLGINMQGGDERKRYLRQVQKTGRRNPVIEQMLKDGTYGKDTRYLVQTGDGEKEVTFGQLISDYSDQVRSAEVIRGADDITGRKVSEIFQIEEGKQGKSATQDAKSGWDKGKNEDTIYSDKGSTRSGTSGKVTIELTDEARRLVGIRTSGAAVASRTGGVNPTTPPESR